MNAIPANEFTHDVFLSHSSKDKPVVRELAARLKKDGIRVWLDEEQVKPGDSIPAKIEEGLEHSRVLVLCMSANAFGSDWAQLEAGTFRFRDPLNKERRFIPLRLDAAPIKGSLAQFLYLNWHPSVREQEYEKLLHACRDPTSWVQTSNSVTPPGTLQTFRTGKVSPDHKALAYLVAVSALLVVGFLLWPTVTGTRHTGMTSTAPTGTNSQPNIHSRQLASLESFYDHLDYMGDRFAERDEFKREVAGQSIEWQGLVVDLHDQGSSLNLAIRSTNQNRLMSRCSVSFPFSERSRLFGLRIGDLVRVTGSIKELLPEAVYVFGTNFSLEQP